MTPKKFENGKSDKGSRKLLKNIFYNSGAWTINVLIALIITPYIVYKLDIEGYGIYALIKSMIGYYSLLDLGLGQGVIKFVAHYRAKRNEDGINRSINASLWVQIMLGILGSFLLIVFTPNLIELLNISPKFKTEALVGFYLSAVGFFFTMLTGTFRSVVLGFQRYDLTSKIAVLNNLVLTVIIVILLYLEYGIKEIILINVIDSIILFSLYIIIVYKIFSNFRLKIVPEFGYFKKILNFSSFIFVSKISTNFNNYFLKFIISFILGPEAVTFYDLPMKIINAFKGILSNITNVFFPLASELNAQKKYDKLKKIYLNSIKGVVVIGLPFFIFMIIFSKQILILWMGINFAEKDWIVMSLLAGAFFLSSLSMIPTNILLGLGHSKIISAFSIILLITNVVFVVPLSEFIGINGTATGILLAQIISPIYVLYITKRIIKIPLLQYIKEVYLYPSIVLLVSIFFFCFNYFILKQKLNLFLIIYISLFFLIFYLATYYIRYFNFNILMTLKKQLIKD